MAAFAKLYLMEQEHDHFTNNAFQQGRDLINEAHEDMIEYRATKKTVTDLLLYKKALMETGSGDNEKINEIKRKALAAINHLFNDLIVSSKVRS